MPGQSQLTEREQQILALLSLGKSYQEIAQVTWLFLNTVKTHVKTIYAKPEHAPREIKSAAPGAVGFQGKPMLHASASSPT